MALFFIFRLFELEVVWDLEISASKFPQSGKIAVIVDLPAVHGEPSRCTADGRF